MTLKVDSPLYFQYFMAISKSTVLLQFNTMNQTMFQRIANQTELVKVILGQVLARGEEFRIVFRATSSEDVFVRILVDGLNTLSQPRPGITTRGIVIEAADPDSEGENTIAPRVSLEEARPWVVLANERRIIEVPGFFDVSTDNHIVRRFQIVDADEAVAARRNYTEQIGLITVAFYRGVPAPGEVSAGTRGRVGTGMGAAERTNLERYRGEKVPGDLIAVYNIRYMTPEMLRQTVR